MSAVINAAFLDVRIAYCDEVTAACYHIALHTRHAHSVFTLLLRPTYYNREDNTQPNWKMPFDRKSKLRKKKRSIVFKAL